MAQPPRFLDSTNPTHVCKLYKAIYGLKQAPRAWYTELRTFFTSFGFTPMISDPSLFKYSHANVSFYLLVYVDEIIITCPSLHYLKSFIAHLFARFSLRTSVLSHISLVSRLCPTKMVSFSIKLNTSPIYLLALKCSGLIPLAPPCFLLLLPLSTIAYHSPLPLSIVLLLLPSNIYPSLVQMLLSLLTNSLNSCIILQMNTSRP